LNRARSLAAALVVALCALVVPVAQVAPAGIASQNVFATPVTSIQDDSFFNRKALDVVSNGEGDTIAVWIEEHPKVPGPGTECQAMYAFRNPGQSFSCAREKHRRAGEAG
jgi:hypothetical protein